MNRLEQQQQLQHVESSGVIRKILPTGDEVTIREIPQQQFGRLDASDLIDVAFGHAGKAGCDIKITGKIGDMEFSVESSKEPG